MRIESDGHSRGNPRLYELIEHAPKTGKSPTVWAWPELVDYLKIAGQPVAGPRLRVDAGRRTGPRILPAVYRGFSRCGDGAGRGARAGGAGGCGRFSASAAAAAP